MKRRIFLKGTLAGSVIAVAVGAGVLSPRQVLAATWPSNAFEAKTAQDALKAMFGSDLTDASNDIDIKAPEIAENGAVVPITIETTMKGVESISIIADKNPTALVATFTLGETTKPMVATRIKMGKTGNVIAVVKANGKLYSARKEVKVTIGGCGG